MSFWEGSAWQDRMDREREERSKLRARIIKENPSLYPRDLDAVVEAEWARLHPPAPAKCCPCQSRMRAEMISTPGGPTRCACACHLGKGQDIDEERVKRCARALADALLDANSQRALEIADGELRAANARVTSSRSMSTGSVVDVTRPSTAGRRKVSR